MIYSWPDSSGTADHLNTSYATNSITIHGCYYGGTTPEIDHDWGPAYVPLRWGPVAWGWLCQLRVERRRALAPARVVKLPRRPGLQPHKQLYHSESRRRRMHRAGVNIQRRRR
jgi:hypothetical protein